MKHLRKDGASDVIHTFNYITKQKVQKIVVLYIFVEKQVT